MADMSLASLLVFAGESRASAAVSLPWTERMTSWVSTSSHKSVLMLVPQGYMSLSL